MKFRGFPQNRIWGSLLLLLLTMGLLAGVSYAWLATFYETKQPVSFDTGTTSPIPVHMWVYNTAEEGNEGWTEYVASATGGEDETAILPSILSKTGSDGTAYQYDVRAMHLGAINDLISVSNDNIVYFRFDLDGTTHGTNITLRHSFEGISGYNRDGAALSAEILQNLTALEGQSSHLKYEYAISETPCTPAEEAISLLSWREMPPQTDESGRDCYLLQGQLNYSEKYYLYLRAYPDLSTLLRTAIILSAQMPSQLFFDIKMDLEVHPNVIP